MTSLNAYGIFHRSKDGPAEPMYVHSLQMGPVVPNHTSWLTEDGTGQVVPIEPGAYIPGKEYKEYATFISAKTNPGRMTAVDPNSGRTC